MNVNYTKMDTQQERVFALKQFILNAPASNAEHQQALECLHGITQHYTAQIVSMKNQVDALSKQVKELENKSTSKSQKNRDHENSK